MDDMTTGIIEIGTTGTELVERVAGDQHPVAIYLGSKSPGSRRAIRQKLDVAAGLLSGGAFDAMALPWAGVRYQHVARLRQMLVEAGKAPATVNATLSAAKAVLRECWRLGQMDAEAYHRACDVEAVKAETLPTGRDLAHGEVAALVAACAADPSPAGARDQAVLALFSAGLRRAELVALNVEDYDASTGGLRVLGAKGGKSRMAYLSTGAKAALADWLAVRGEAPGALVCPVSRSGKVEVRSISAQAVRAMLEDRRIEARVAPFSPHDFRRTFIGNLLDAGADLLTVAKLVGHAKPATTMRYDRRDERGKQDAVGRVNFPHVARRAA